MLLAAMLVAVSAAPPREDIPFHKPSLKGDPPVMALALRAVGAACRWRDGQNGPYVPGFDALAGVGQTFHPQGAIVVRRRGAQRVAFLARISGGRCRILDVQPLPPSSRRESFEQCTVPDPRAEVDTPLADGLGLHERGSTAITYFLEADFKRGGLIQRDPVGDPRYRCNGFESPL